MGTHGVLQAGITVVCFNNSLMSCEMLFSHLSLLNHILRLTWLISIEKLADDLFKTSFTRKIQSTVYLCPFGAHKTHL